MLRQTKTQTEVEECCKGDVCENSLYSQMVENLAGFVIRIATKDNPTDAELNAMTNMAKMLFRTM